MVTKFIYLFHFLNFSVTNYLFFNFDYFTFLPLMVTIFFDHLCYGLIFVEKESTKCD